MSQRRAGRRFALALAISALVTVIWAAPLVLHLNSRFLGGPSDATSTVRDYWYEAHIGKSPFSARRDTLVAAPEGVELAPSVQVANGFQPAIIWLLKGVTGLVAAWNLFILAGIVLTASCTWLLLDSLGVGALPASFGAYAFAFSGYLVDKAFAGHGGLVHAWLFPVLLLVLLRGRAGHARRHAAIAGLVVALAFYVHSYYGFFALFFIGLFYLFELAWDPEHRRGPAGDLGTALAATFVGLLPALVAVHVMAGSPGTGSHAVAALQQFGARVPAYLAPAHWTPLGHLVPHGLRPRLIESGEPSLFFGFSTIALAVIYVLKRRQDATRSGSERFTAAFALVLVVSAFVMSLPRLFGVGPVQAPMPSWFVGHITTVWRVYARFGVLVGLGLVLLAAFSLAWVQRTRGVRWASCLLIVLVVELTPTFPATTWAANNVPAADRWLAAHPGGIAAIYPLVGDQIAAADLNGEEYYYQRFHGHPLFSAIVPSMGRLALALRVVSQYFTSPDTAHILAAEHVHYLVLRDDVYRKMHQQPPTLSTTDFTLVARVRDARIFVVRAQPADLVAYVSQHATDLAAAVGQQPPVDHFGKGFFGPETYKYATPWRWMSQNATITVTPVAGVERLQFESLAFSNARPHTLRLYGPKHNLLGQVDVPTGMTPIKIGPFAAQGGASSTYTLESSPEPQQLSAADPRVTSVYLNQPVFRPVLVPPGS